MPKTNHLREFKAKRHETPPGDWCRGKHGAAKNERGKKKFARSRNRFHDKMNIITAIKDDTVEDILLEPRKLRTGVRRKDNIRRPGDHNSEGTGPYSDTTMIERGFVKISKNCWKQVL